MVLRYGHPNRLVESVRFLCFLSSHLCGWDAGADCTPGSIVDDGGPSVALSLNTSVDWSWLLATFEILSEWEIKLCRARA